MNRRPRRPVSTGRYPLLDAELEARGWTVADLARSAGISYARIARAITGQTAPSDSTMESTARVLNLRPHQLWQKESHAPRIDGAAKG